MTKRHVFVRDEVIGAIIRDELEELADHFEGAGPDAPWTGQEIADHIRDRVKNHPALSTAECTKGE